MIFECAYCESKVDGKPLGEHKFYGGEEPPSRVTLLECPVCHDSSLVSQEIWEGFSSTGEHVTDWDDPIRVWPGAEKNLDWRLPETVRKSLEEARLCHKVKAFNACAVMCGRALEGVCVEFKLGKKFLAGGLKELLDKGIIDKKIYSWGDALRKHRNIGAHANEQKISKEDAKDLLDFAIAICDYIFVLNKKFEEFMNRKEKQM